MRSMSKSVPRHPIMISPRPNARLKACRGASKGVQYARCPQRCSCAFRSRSRRAAWCRPCSRRAARTPRSSCSWSPASSHGSSLERSDGYWSYTFPRLGSSKGQSVCHLALRLSPYSMGCVVEWLGRLGGVWKLVGSNPFGVASVILAAGHARVRTGRRRLTSRRCSSRSMAWWMSCQARQPTSFGHHRRRAKEEQVFWYQGKDIDIARGFTIRLLTR